MTFSILLESWKIINVHMVWVVAISPTWLIRQPHFPRLLFLELEIKSRALGILHFTLFSKHHTTECLLFTLHDSEEIRPGQWVLTHLCGVVGLIAGSWTRFHTWDKHLHKSWSPAGREGTIISRIGYCSRWMDTKGSSKIKGVSSSWTAMKTMVSLQNCVCPFLPRPL